MNPPIQFPCLRIFLEVPQETIWILRSRGLTYLQIRQEFQRETGIALSSDTQIVRALRATALGYQWTPTSVGGRPPYLCLEDEIALVSDVSESARDLSSLPKWVVLNLAHERKIQRVHTARAALHKLGCPVIAGGIEDPDEPDETWLKDFAKRNDLRIKNGEQIEDIRRTTCDRERVAEWFRRFAQKLQLYHPSMIFNMDETGISSNRKYKVVVPQGRSGIVAGGGKHQHITGIVCYNRSGNHPKPGIILSQLKNLPGELQQFTDNADFYSSPTGWITSDVFGKWAVNFAHWVRRWKTGLEPARRQRRVLLLMDGHTSRRNVDAINYLWAHGIDVLTFPGHCTHVMQPFDVAVAAPLKAALRKNIEKIQRKMATGSFWGWTQAAVKRYTLVASFLDAFHKAVTPLNAASSFEATGIVPVNAFRVLNNRYVTTPKHAQCAQEWQNSMYIEGPMDIRWMATQNGRLTRQGLILGLMSLTDLLLARPSGLLLSRMEPL